MRQFRDAQDFTMMINKVDYHLAFCGGTSGRNTWAYIHKDNYQKRKILLQ